MTSQILDFDLDRDCDGAFRTAPPRRTKMRKGFFSFENPGFVLVLYNFLLALPLSYALTRLNRHIISLIGYEMIMRCPPGILFSRLLFVALNMWLVVGWGLQLEKEARKRKNRRIENVREDITWWEEEVERLEGCLGEVRQLEVEEQLRGERPAAFFRSAQGTTHCSTPDHHSYGNGKWNRRGLGSQGDSQYGLGQWRAADVEREQEEEGSGLSGDEDFEGEDADEDGESGDEEGDSEWNGDD